MTEGRLGSGPPAASPATSEDRQVRALLILGLAGACLLAVLTPVWQSQRVRAATEAELLRRTVELARVLDPGEVEAEGFLDPTRGRLSDPRLSSQLGRFGAQVSGASAGLLLYRDGELLAGPPGSWPELGGEVWPNPPPELLALVQTGATGLLTADLPVDGPALLAVAPAGAISTPPLVSVVAVLPLAVLQARVQAARWDPTLGLLLLAILLGVLAVVILSRRPGAADPSRHDRRVAVWLVATVGLLLTASLYRFGDQDYAARQRLRFEQAAGEQAWLIATELSQQLTNLETVGRLFYASEEVDADEFEVFVAPLAAASTFRALDWVEAVPAADLDAHLARQRERWPEYTISELGPDGRLRPAAPRAVAYPVSYVHPVEPNRHVLGYDLGSDAERLAAVERARDTGLPAATGGLSLVSDHGEQLGILVLVPVYRTHRTEPTVAARRAELRGFVLGVCRVGDVVPAVLRHASTAGLRHRLLDLTDAANPEVLHEPATPAVNVTTFSASAEFRFADRLLRLETTPEEQFLTGWGGRPTYRLLAPLGLLVTWLLVVVLRGAATAADRAQYLVTERTAELAVSEERYRLVVDAVTDGVWDWDYPANRVVWSARAFTMLGFEPDAFPVTLEKWTELLHPDDREPTRQRLAAQLAADDTFVLEFRARRADGSYAWLEGRGRVVSRDAAGQPVRLVGTHVDIDERKQAELALRESESRLQALFDNALDAMLIRDDAGLIVDANPAALALLGYERHQLKDVQAAVIAPPEQEEIWERLWERFLRDGRQRGEIELIRRDGSRLIAEYQATADFAPGLHLSVLRDTTERRHAEEVQRENAESFRRLFEDSSDPVLLLDETGRIDRCNQATVVILGYESDDAIVGRHPVELSPPLQPDGQESSVLAQILIEEAATLGHRRFEWLHQRADGSPLPVEVMLTPIWFRGRHLLHTAWRDISERKIHEWRLRRINELLLNFGSDQQANIAATVALAGELLEADGAAFARFHQQGAQPPVAVGSLVGEVALGAAIEPLLDPAADDVLLAPLAAGVCGVDDAMDDGHDPVVLAHLVRHGAERVGALCLGRRTATSPSLEERQLLGILAAAISVQVDRERLESQLRQASRMEAIGHLAGGVAHDFNNLLQVVLGNLEMARDVCADGTCEQELAEALQAGRRAAELTAQLLAFSRQQMLQPRPIDLVDVLTDTMRMMRRLIGDLIVVELRCAPGLPLVLADPGQVEQVVMNLCLNARDAMPEGGAITLETELAELTPDHCRGRDWARPGRFVKLTVADTGCGMDAATLDRVFDPFFTTKEIGKGTGLGLATVYGIVRQHNGLVEVESAVGEGSRFHIYLPLAEAPPARSEPAAAAARVAPSRAGLVALLAEDEPAVRRLAERTLTQAGIEVVSAVDGEDALRLYHQHRDRIGLLVLDVLMPRLGGRAVLEAIRAERPDLPCLFVSGYTEGGLEPAVVERLGASALAKPYDRETLLAAIARIVPERAG